MRPAAELRAQNAPEAERPPAVLRFPGDLATPVRAFLALAAGPARRASSWNPLPAAIPGPLLVPGVRALRDLQAGTRAAVRVDGRSFPMPGSPAKALERWVLRFALSPGVRGARSLPRRRRGLDGLLLLSAYHEPVLEASFPRARAHPGGASASSPPAWSSTTSGRRGTSTASPPPARAPKPRPGTVLEDLRRRLEGALSPGRAAWGSQDRAPDRGRFSRNLAAVQEAILAGDAYQIVLSEPFGGRFDGDPFEVYRRAAAAQPSPYHFYVSLGGRQVVGASPEMMVRVEGRRGHHGAHRGARRRRGATAAEDSDLERELQADPKELAEHAMLVDLARNDLGRVCEYGSVEVPVRGVVERFSHVMHMTSEVQGRLAHGANGPGRALEHLPGGHRERRARRSGPSRS